MSRRNGDRCKFHINRKRKLLRRVAMRTARARVLEALAAAPKQDV
jgi:hypothetical protein